MGKSLRWYKGLGSKFNMISILIPVKNYDLDELIKSLTSQLEKIEIHWEIIFCEDGSDEDYRDRNRELQGFDVQQYYFKVNRGRNQTRDFLAHQANGDFCLFLDADKLPLKDDFISSYVSAISTYPDAALFGGYSYSESKPQAEKELRWAYGHQKESRPAKYRNRSPYRSTFSGNMLIPKQTFLNISPKLTSYGYGSDIALGTWLKKANVEVVHLDNPVIHLGLESNETFVNKTKLAVDTLTELYKSGELAGHEHSLLKAAQKIDTLGFTSFFSLLYKRFHRSMEQKLISGPVSVRRLQIYKLLYACQKLNCDG